MRCEMITITKDCWENCCKGFFKKIKIKPALRRTYRGRRQWVLLINPKKQSRMSAIPNGQDLKWTRSRIDTNSNGDNPEGVQFQINAIPKLIEMIPNDQSQMNTITNLRMGTYTTFILLLWCCIRIAW